MTVKTTEHALTSLVVMRAYVCWDGLALRVKVVSNCVNSNYFCMSQCMRFWYLSPKFNVHGDVSSEAKGLNVRLSLHRHSHFVHASTKKLLWVCAFAWQLNKYPTLMCCMRGSRKLRQRGSNSDNVFYEGRIDDLNSSKSGPSSAY